MKKAKITVSDSTLIPCPSLSFGDDDLMHLADISRPCLDALMVTVRELFYLETIPCSHFPFSFQVFSSDRAAQAFTVQIACAFEQLVILFRHWLDDFPPGTSSARLEDELRQDIKKLGGYLQLFLQVR